MGRERIDLARAEPLERRRGLGDRPRRVDHVVRDEAVLVGHLTDHVHDLGHVRGGPPEAGPGGPGARSRSTAAPPWSAPRSPVARRRSGTTAPGGSPPAGWSAG